jgi:hypothetical protein
MNSAEQFAQDYLRKYGLRPERFTKAEMRRSKTPDFRAFQGEELVLYCEAKHVQRDEWLDKKLKNAKPLELVGGLRPDPIFNRLSNHIHEAAQQFNAVNPDHRYPNVLVFVNSDRHCGVADLRSVLTGNFYAKDGSVEPIYTEYSEGRIREEKLAIDLYIWRDEWRPPEKVGGCFWKNPKYREVLRKLLPSERMWGDSSPSQAAIPSSSSITENREKEKLQARSKEIDPKLRGFIERLIVPALVDRYLKQIRQKSQD